MEGLLDRKDGGSKWSKITCKLQGHAMELEGLSPMSVVQVVDVPNRMLKRKWRFDVVLQEAAAQTRTVALAAPGAAEKQRWVSALTEAAAAHTPQQGTAQASAAPAHGAATMAADAFAALEAHPYLAIGRRQYPAS